eukprot:5169314-Alexandrium_andersonii.AAC.1
MMGPSEFPRRSRQGRSRAASVRGGPTRAEPARNRAARLLATSKQFWHSKVRRPVYLRTPEAIRIAR